MQVLLSHFDAFKFPSSEVVQFRALVTPCMPSCEPVQCDQEESTGELRSVVSYGRRKRRSANPVIDDMLLVQSIQITDKFGFDHRNMSKSSSSIGSETMYLPTSEPGLCINMAGLIVAGTVFLAAQLAVIAAWTFIWQKRKANSKFGNDNMSINFSMPSGMNASRTDSLCKLYEGGYIHSRRF